jgi:hypothetical protein
MTRLDSLRADSIRKARGDSARRVPTVPPATRTGPPPPRGR